MSPQGRRAALPDFSAVAAEHAGLLLDKYIGDLTPDDGEINQHRRILLEKVAALPVTSLYRQFFQRWQQSLEAMKQESTGQTILIASASTQLKQSRLAVGLGAESILESNIALHKTYGVPYIPGTALKGLTAAYARKNLANEVWKQDGTAYITLFGDTVSRGYVTFFDALYDPTSVVSGGLLTKDVLTVHHGDYYADKQNAAPADWDNPTPVTFVTATGRFLVALGGPTAWVDTAFEILKLALADEGVGAKTSSGYGRMDLTRVNTPSSSATETTSTESYNSLKKQLLSQKAPAGRTRGVVFKVNEGFAFINPASGGSEVFISQERIDIKLRAGMVVEYATVPGKKAKQLAAVEVIVLLLPNP